MTCGSCGRVWGRQRDPWETDRERVFELIRFAARVLWLPASLLVVLTVVNVLLWSTMP